MYICRKQPEIVHYCILILLGFVGTLELARVTLVTQYLHTNRAIKAETCFRARSPGTELPTHLHRLTPSNLHTPCNLTCLVFVLFCFFQSSIAE